MELNVEQVNEPGDFDRIVANMLRKIQLNGDVDYLKLREELKGLQAPLCGEFSPNALAEDMARIQGFKDRAVEIVSVLTENYLIHKRVSEILVKGWTKFSVEKSAEKREGEALLKLSSFILAATDAESAYRYALGIQKNLESQMENASRQISCVQAAAKINDPRYAFEADPFSKVRARQEIANGVDDNEDHVTDWDRFDEQKMLPSE